MTETLKRTPLFEEHRRAGGKMVPYAGFEMPVQYGTGIQAEHRAVREAAGLFDVSHMGEFSVEGPDALAFVGSLTVNDPTTLKVGQAQYSAFCAEDGTVIDDLLVYRTGQESLLLVVNAGNREGDWAWVNDHLRSHDIALDDRSDRTALLALQGPRAAEIFAPLTELELDGIAFYRLAEGEVAGVPCLVARTGYTGEDGFELYHDAEHAPELWKALLEAGEAKGLVPAGLGARDTLRLEVGYPLYGNDLDRSHTALESGLGWIVKLDRGDFVGRKALLQQKEQGVNRRLTGVRLVERGFPRPGYSVFSGGREVGTVTSGTVSPTLGEGIALTYLPMNLTEPGTSVDVRIRNKDVKGVVERPPFYRDGSLKR
ncbi:MAG: glycine cleavage system aminomethyltransferase GcvT [Gemmatimonadota bacterium]